MGRYNEKVSRNDKQNRKSDKERERERTRPRALVCDISGFGCEREAGTLGVCK